MKWNPHVHVLLADRAIEKKSGKVRKFSFLLYRTFHKVWQYKFLNFLKKEFQGNETVQEKINACWKAHPEGFYVNVQKPMKDAKQTIFYIGRYLGRAAIAEYRIVKYDGQEVTFWYEDHETGKREYVTLPVYAFMARLVQHIPAKNFQMVKRYGWAHHRFQGGCSKSKISSNLPLTHARRRCNKLLKPSLPHDIAYIERIARRLACDCRGNAGGHRNFYWLTQSKF